MGFMSGKRVLIFGVASNRSIAWGVAEAMHREGAELAFTYQGDKLKKRVDQIAEQCGFADQSHLGRWFKRTHGITPARFRRMS